MNTPSPEIHLGIAAAIGWVALWALVLVAIGVNHLATQRPGGGTLLLAAGVVAAFLGSLWSASSQPRSGVAVALNVLMMGALILSAVLLSRRPALFTLHWSTSDGHNIALVVSWLWIALLWLSVLGAGAVAEVHHVLHSRAR
jgi:hypothetical protein